MSGSKPETGSIQNHFPILSWIGLQGKSGRRLQMEMLQQVISFFYFQKRKTWMQVFTFSD
jgi:hypothetical protein